MKGKPLYKFRQISFITIKKTIYFLIVFLAVFLISIQPVNAQAPQVLKDINPYLTLSSQTTSGYNYKGYNGYVYFSADNGINGYELWKTDGTEANTVLVKDINTGVSSSNPQSYTEMGGVLFFIATTSSNGTELWKTDGTEANTVLVKDINTGTASSSPANLKVINGVLYFIATSATSGRELWRSDGTEAGTFLVKDIHTGASGSNPSAFTEAGSLFYFTADDNINGEELWVSDGTTAGTFLLKDIYPGFSPSYISYLTPVGNTVFFQAEDDVNGLELWKSDGTPAGTVLVKDIEPGLDGSNPYYLINFNGTLFFTATTIANGTELWKSDGTESGTVLVKDINVLGSGGVPTELTVAGSQLFFNAFTDANGIELWKSDGTTAGTILVKDINPGTAHGVPSNFIYVNNTLFFTATTSSNGTELWKSDGTESGTVLVQDINPGTLSSSPSRFTDVNGTLFFTATQNGQVVLLKTDGTSAGTVPLNSAVVSGGTYASFYGYANKLFFMYDGYKPGIPSTATGREPWVSDGTNAGTMLVKDINTVPNTNNGNPGSLLRVGNIVYFAANNGTSGTELWKTDGTEAGTVLLKDIVPGSSSSSPANLTNVNGTIFFTASSTGFGIELWKTDGTEAGTVLVKDIRTGTSSSSPTLLTASGNLLYFVATDGTTGNELWKSDGTAAGTVLVSDIVPGLGTPNIQTPVNVSGTLFFRATVTGFGTELWKSDGTAAGTALVKDIIAGTGSPGIDDMIAYNGKLYFSANDGVNGNEPWVSDGTAAGTTLFVNIATSGTFPNSNPTNFAVANNLLYFTAFTASTQFEPWVSDGTPGGTYMITEIVPGGSGGGGSGFVYMNGYVYFDANGPLGHELWRTDNTAAGTTLVKDINTGSGDGNPQQLTVVNNTLFFRATTSTGGVEFYKSDGTAAGTVAYDLYPGTTASTPDFLSALNSKIIFTATHPQMGREIWKAYAPPTSDFTVVGDTTPCVNGTAVYAATGVVNDSTSYTWSLPLGGGTIISAADTVVVQWDTAGSRSVQLVLSNIAGNSAPKQRSLVVSGTAPARVPVIFNFARNLSVDSVLQSASLQWFRNDTIINGANSSSYYAGLAGSYTVKYKNNCGYGPVSNAFNFPADTLSQTITFPHTDTVAMSPAAKTVLLATASSGLPVFYQKVSGPGNIVNDTLFITGVGTIIVKALQPGDDVYSAAAPVYDTIIVKKGSQFINFDSIPPKIYPAAAFPLTANSSVGLPVSFSVITGPASVSNGNLAILGAGTITVRASQNGDTSYNAATPVDRTFCAGIRTLTSITGITSPCFATYQYNTQKIAGANYTWTLSGGGILTTSNDTAWVQWQTAGTHILTVKANSTCDPVYTNEQQISITTSNNTTIGAVTGMLPANGIVDQQLPLRLSWIPGINTVNYDLYVWDSATAEPLVPYVSNIAAISYTLPKNAPFPYNKTYKWRVVSKNPCAQIPGPVQTFRLIPLPDLVISDIQAPASATSGQTITISWKVTNIGPGKTLLNQSWEDGIYFALDTVPNVNLGNPFPFPTSWSQLTAAGRPLLLGKKNRPAALDSGQFYTNSINFTLPLGYNFPVYVYGIAANNGVIYRILQVSNLNDTARAPNQIIITQPPVPDLRVDSVFTPASIFSGSTMNITYKVKNYGVVTPAGGQWVDSFFISQNPLFDRNQCIPLNAPKPNGSYYPNADGAAAYNNIQLNTDSSTTRNQQVVIPNFIFGTWFIYVKTNAGTTTGNYIYEGALNNNNVNQAQLQVYLTPTPKLTISSLTVPVNTASTTQPIGVNWNIKNEGFQDNIERNRGHYITMSTCRVPCPPQSPPGSICIGPSVIKDSVVFGSSYWVDRVYLSTDPGGLNIANAVMVKEVKHGTENSGVYADAPAPTYSFVSCPALAGSNINISNVIKPAANFPKSENFTIPSNLPPGNYYVYIYTNPTKKVFEYPGTPQIRRSDLPILIQRPDAIVSSISGPSTATGGQTIQVNYDITNNGPGAVFNHQRNDRLYISNNPVFDGTAAIIATQTFTENLPVGTAVPHTFSYTIPLATTGTKYFYVIANYDSLFKETNQTNNTSTAAAITVSAAPPADLMVSSVHLQDSVLIQSPTLFRYTVINNGTGPALGNWTDSIFLSCSPVFNASTAKFIAKRTQTRVVMPSGNYTDSFTLVIPKMSYEINNCFPQQLYAQGYFYVKANADSGAYEGAAFNNNINGSGGRVVINPLVDHILVAASVNRDTISVGTPFSASWKVKNNGYKPTEAYYYFYDDGIYFSPDSLVNANDVLAFGFRNYNTINRNDSLVTTKAVMPPDLPTGDYYVIAKTNYSNRIPAEKVFGNNYDFVRTISGEAKKIHLVRPPLPDLVDTILSAPAAVAMGQPFSVIYKITNIGSAVTFPGAWRNDLYLSADFQLQVGDRLLTGKTRTTPLAPGASFIDTVTCTMPLNLAPGNYVLIAKANSNFAVTESDLTNNLGFGIIEAQLPDSTDLLVENVMRPDTVYLGYTIDTAKWVVKNNSGVRARGWVTDGIYLSASNLLDSTADLLGTKRRYSDLLPMEKDTLALTPAVINAIEGNYNLFAKTDLLNNIIELDKTNNTGVAATPIYVKAKELLLGIPGLNTLQTVNRYYKLRIPDSLRGATILVTLKTNDSLLVRNEMYIGGGFVPTPANYDYRFETPNYGNQQIVISDVSDSVYYIMYRCVTANPPVQNITLLAVQLPFAILDVHTNSGGNIGNVTVRIKGSLFRDSMVAKLSNGTTTIYASAVYYTNNTQVFATFPLQGKPTGLYDLTLIKPDSSTAVLTNGFSIVAANNGGLITGGGPNTGPGNGNAPGCDPGAASGLNSQLVVELIVPDKVVRGRPVVIVINFNNPTNFDLPVQTRILYNDEEVKMAFTKAGIPNGTSALYIEFSEADGPPGILRPGGGGSIIVHCFAPPQVPEDRSVLFKLQ